MDFSELNRRHPLIVAGIDPGTYVLGFGIVGRSGQELRAVDFGTFSPPRSADTAARLLFLKKEVSRLLDHHRPDVVALEQVFVKINVQSALRVGEARACVLLAAAECGIPVVQYPTATAKKRVCGHGGAVKTSVQAMVQHHLSLEVVPEPHDAADALALALCLLFDPMLTMPAEAAS